jgi:hypothetical protein
MKKLWVAAVVTATVAFQAPAKAGVTFTVLAPGVTITGFPTETFDSPQVNVGPAIGGPGTDGGTYSGNGLVVNGSVSGVYAAPFFGPGQDTTNYVEVGPGNDPEKISYSGPKDFFGLYWGSIDTYNTLDFYSGSTLVKSYTGADILPLTANGNQTSFASNRYVEFFFSGVTYDNVVLGSSGPCAPNSSCNFPGSTAAFEFDNVATSAPEPATWIMMLLGFAGLGFVAYRRTKKGSVAA